MRGADSLTQAFRQLDEALASAQFPPPLPGADEHRALTVSPGHPVRTSFDNALRRKGLTPPVRILDGLEIGLVLALLAHADAVNLMPARLAEQLQAQGRLRIIGGDGFTDLGIYLATTAFVHAEQERTPEVMMLLECLRRVVSMQVLT